MADFAVLVLHSAHHQADREQVAILVQAALFAHPELLGRYRLAHILFQVIAIVGGPEPDDMLADHLIIGKTGDAGKGVVDLEDDPLVIHHQQAVVGVESHLGQPQGFVGGQALQFDCGPLVLAAESVEQWHGVRQRRVEQQSELADGGTVLAVQRNADIDAGIECQQLAGLGIAQRQVFHIDRLAVLEQLLAGARVHLDGFEHREGLPSSTQRGSSTTPGRGAGTRRSSRCGRR